MILIHPGGGRRVSGIASEHTTGGKVVCTLDKLSCGHHDLGAHAFVIDFLLLLSAAAASSSPGRAVGLVN